MSFLDDDEPTPWGANDGYDPEPSPWGAPSDNEDEHDTLVSPSPEDDPYSNTSAQIDSSQLLGASTPSTGLQFVSTATPDPEGSPKPRKSPNRRARSSKIKKPAAEVEAIEAGPLTGGSDGPHNDAGSPRNSIGVSSRGAKGPLVLESVDLDPTPAPAASAVEEVRSPSPEPQELPGTLKINVGDPSKVGDITSAHIIYTINTTTDLDIFPQQERLYSVTRRYRDFRWLYKALISNNPGCIVPPPPEKQVFGTMNEDFVEQRRAALETMLVKIAAHPILRVDLDLVAFLTHPDFAEHLKTRVISDEELEAAAVSGGGFLGLSVFGKNDEIDTWLAEKRVELDGIEVQLRGLAKAFELLHSQRKDLAASLTDLANVTTAMADIEPTRNLEIVLREFAKVQSRLTDLYLRQRQQDALFIETTVDGQVRLVNSIRDACNAKQRLQVAATSARALASKKEAALDKLHKQHSDRVPQVEAETKQAVEKAEHTEKAYDAASQRLDSELSRVEREKVIDFRNAVELFLENAVESQKQSIEMWETFYSRYFTK